MATRYFSLDQARALIPQVRSRLGTALQLHSVLRQLVETINDAGYDVDWATLHGEVELDDEASAADIRNLEKARGLYAMLRDVVDDIEALGPEVKGVVDGLVDFHSFRDGEQEVLLCWKMGEPTIAHYHGLREGMAGRKPLGDHEFLAEARERHIERGADLITEAKAAGALRTPLK